jgi:diguanylate cyclase (GGDEF)-like protein
VHTYWKNIGSHGERFARWRARYSWVSLAVAIAGLIISTLAWFAVSHREDRLAELELSSRAEGHALSLQVGIISYLRKVSGLAALFESSDAVVSRAQFEKFTKLVMNDQNAILGMSWIPRVMRDHRAAHESAAMLEGIPDYQIKRVAPDGSMARSPEKNDYFPVLYTATESSRSPVYGLDLNDGGVRQRTLEHARDTGAIATSPMFTLQSGTGYRRGFFVALPVYAPALPHQTVEERKLNLSGYVQAVFQTSVLIETILRTTKAGALDLYFYETDRGGGTSELIYFHGSRLRPVPVEPLSRSAVSTGPKWKGMIQVGDARWTMIAVPIPGGPGTAVHKGAWMALIFCLFVSGIIAAYIWLSGRHSEHLQISNTQLDHTLGTLNIVNNELSAALHNMVQGFIMFDSQERIAVYNERYIDMYGLSRDIVKPGCSFMELLQHRAACGNLKADPKQYHDDLVAELAKGQVVNLIINSGNDREILITNKPMPGGGWVATHEDITDRRRAEAKITHMALHDGLTDLANRHLFNEEIADCFKQLARGQKFALLCLDLDHFKNVNDTLGHPLGDKLLQQIGTRLRLCVRESDTIARLGGDEFAILQRGIADPAEARSLSERIVKAIRKPFNLEGNQVVIGVSIGIALAPTDATDEVELLKAADIALFCSKADGRGTYRCFAPAMDERIRARHAIERDLRKALLNDEFVMHYQPFVNLQSGQISAFEALIRWNHPERGMLFPIDFIPFAEETGLIVPIGQWALRRACKDAAGWPNGVDLAVNLSPVQFKELDLCAMVIGALADCGLTASRLELEITETALLDNEESTAETMRQMRALGVRIVMDDFGTGHSSLTTLRNYPFDKIKIDRSFVHDLLSKHDSRAIIQALVQLAGSLGLKTTAEGVETQGELDYLKRVGCTEAQGFFFSKPLPQKEVYALLNAGLRAEASVA